MGSGRRGTKQDTHTSSDGREMTFFDRMRGRDDTTERPAAAKFTDRTRYFITESTYTYTYLDEAAGSSSRVAPHIIPTCICCSLNTYNKHALPHTACFERTWPRTSRRIVGSMFVMRPRFLRIEGAARGEIWRTPNNEVSPALCRSGLSPLFFEGELGHQSCVECSMYYIHTTK